jgi:hypothetical protein
MFLEVKKAQTCSVTTGLRFLFSFIYTFTGGLPDASVFLFSIIKDLA